MLALPAVCVNAATTITSNQSGTQDGYYYELWKDSGTTSMTLDSGGTFSAQWSNIGNALFRKGKKFDETQTHQQIGNITVNYSANYQPNGNSYLCVYGWTVDPLIEYYIVDSWGSWRPPGGTSKGTITVDGERMTYMRLPESTNLQLKAQQPLNNIGVSGRPNVQAEPYLLVNTLKRGRAEECQWGRCMKLRLR